MDARGEHAKSGQKGQSRDSNSEPSYCEVTVLTTAPCHPRTMPCSFNHPMSPLQHPAFLLTFPSTLLSSTLALFLKQGWS